MEENSISHKTQLIQYNSLIESLEQGQFQKQKPLAKNSHKWHTMVWSNATWCVTEIMISIIPSLSMLLKYVL